MSNGNYSGEKRSEVGGAGKGSPRRRYFRRRKPAAKAPESAPKPEARKPLEQPPAKSRTRSNAKTEVASKSERERRGGRRRRRRSRSERVEPLPVVQESTLAAIDHEYTPPEAVFVYTYVLRPGAPSSHEFRPEHFSRVGRRLEDFQIDLSPLFRDESAVSKEAKPFVPAAADEEEAIEFLDEADDEEA